MSNGNTSIGEQEMPSFCHVWAILPIRRTVLIPSSVLFSRRVGCLTAETYRPKDRERSIHQNKINIFYQIPSSRISETNQCGTELCVAEEEDGSDTDGDECEQGDSDMLINQLALTFCFKISYLEWTACMTTTVGIVPILRRTMAVVPIIQLKKEILIF